MAQLARIRRNLVTGAQRKGELIRHLLLHTEWDFFLAVFGECHRGGHILWPESDPASVISANALLDVYQSVDLALGDILKTIDSTAIQVIVFSLHGMQSNTSQEHIVAPVMQRINALFTQQSSNSGQKPAKQRSLMSCYASTCRRICKIPSPKPYPSVSATGWSAGQRRQGMIGIGRRLFHCWPTTTAICDSTSRVGSRRGACKPADPIICVTKSGSRRDFEDCTPLIAECRWWANW